MPSCLEHKAAAVAPWLEKWVPEKPPPDRAWGRESAPSGGFLPVSEAPRQRLMIPSYTSGWLIGKGGFKLKEAREMSGCHIDVGPIGEDRMVPAACVGQ